jgi:hypothetical protein
MTNIAESLPDCQRTRSTEPNTDAAVAWLWAWPTERLHLWAKQTDPHTGAEGGSSGKTFERTDAGRAAMHAWIAARQGKSNIYFHVNDVTPAVTLGMTQRENAEKKIVTVQHASESDNRIGCNDLPLPTKSCIHRAGPGLLRSGRRRLKVISESKKENGSKARVPDHRRKMSADRREPESAQKRAIW